MSLKPIIVLDDIRTLPEETVDCPVIHFREDEEFSAYLDGGGEIFQVVLDHDAGGKAFDPEFTFRASITKMCLMHAAGNINVERAFIVSMNPAGVKWIRMELSAVNIPFNVVPGGKQIGMIAPKGWQ